MHLCLCYDLTIHERGRNHPLRIVRWWLPDGVDILNPRAPVLSLAETIQAELAKPKTLCIFVQSPEGHVERWLPGQTRGERLKRRSTPHPRPLKGKP